MPITAPEVVIESILTAGFADIQANAATYVPLIFAAFPQEYRDLATTFLTDPENKPNIVFGFAYDAPKFPELNIILSSESEGTSTSKQMYLGDIVNRADKIPNTESYERYGSMWSGKISVAVRTQQAKQTIVLYTMVKWLMLKNRVELESNGIMASKFSGTDLIYDASKAPTFMFSRVWSMDCLIMNTWDVDITSDNIIRHVQSSLTEHVRFLDEDGDDDMDNYLAGG